MAVTTQPNISDTNGARVNEVKSATGAVKEVLTQQPDGPEDLDVTKTIANFIVRTTQDDLTPQMVTKLKALLLDYIGVTAAAGFAGESTSTFLAGIEAFAASAQGNNTVLTKGSAFLPQYAALMNGALCHTYDFDDTHGPAILHPGASVISASLAQAESQDATGEELLVALAVGYEVAIRIGIALGNGSYAHGYHNTGTAGIFGAIAAVCNLRHSSLSTVENALGLGISKAAGSMQFLDNGSWNKRLHPGFAAHDALLCVSLASAGVIGATKPIEGQYGALHNFTSSPQPSHHITTALSTTWHFLSTACKPYPACRMTHGLIETIGTLRKHHLSRGTPTAITIHLPPANYPIVGVPTPNKLHPQSTVDAQFSAHFQTAAAWLLGPHLGWAVYDHIADEDVLALCRRVHTAIDPRYSNLETRIRLTFADGTVVEVENIHPLAEPQKPFEWDTGVQAKFWGLAVPVYGEERARVICEWVDGVRACRVRELMRLVA